MAFLRKIDVELGVNALETIRKHGRYWSKGEHEHIYLHLSVIAELGDMEYDLDKYNRLHNFNGLSKTQTLKNAPEKIWYDLVDKCFYHDGGPEATKWIKIMIAALPGDPEDDPNGGCDLPEATPDGAIKVMGNEDIHFSYEIVDASTIHTSHLPQEPFSRNPDYTLENERRYHSESASQKAVIDHALRLDPAYLIDSVDANHGAPIVDGNGNVLGGNSRAMSIMYAYNNNYKNRIEAYHAALRDRGFDLTGIKNPILVRRISCSPEQAQKYVSLFNQVFTASKDRKADAYSRGRRISQATLTVLAGELAEADSLRDLFDQPDSKRLVQMLVEDGAIMPNEANEYINGGYLNPDGKRLIESALRSIVCENLEVLSTLPEPILAKVDAIIPHILIASNIHEHWSIIDVVHEALSLAYEFRQDSAKEFEIFLDRMSFENPITARDRYSLGAQKICSYLLNEKKAQFVSRFRKFAGYAQISEENNGLMPPKTWQEAWRENFGFLPEVENKKEIEINSSNQEIEKENMENNIKQSNNQKEKVEMAVENKPVKTKRQLRNDCTKSNSTLILSDTSDKTDVSGILTKVYRYFGNETGIIAISKTQYRLDNHEGYRIIRSGRQWQLRLLNEYVETMANDPENDVDTIDVENNEIEIYEDGNKDASNTANWLAPMAYTYPLEKPHDRLGAFMLYQGQNMLFIPIYNGDIDYYACGYGTDVYISRNKNEKEFLTYNYIGDDSNIDVYYRNNCHMVYFGFRLDGQKEKDGNGNKQRNIGLLSMSYTYPELIDGLATIIKVKNESVFFIPDRKIDKWDGIRIPLKMDSICVSFLLAELREWKNNRGQYIWYDGQDVYTNIHNPEDRTRKSDCPGIKIPKAEIPLWIIRRLESYWQTEIMCTVIRGLPQPTNCQLLQIGGTTQEIWQWKEYGGVCEYEPSRIERYIMRRHNLRATQLWSGLWRVERRRRNST